MAQTRLQSADLAALVQTGRELAAEVDLQPLLHTILGKACALTGSQKGSVILHNPRRGTLFFASAMGDSSEYLLENWGEFAAQQVPIEGSKAGQVFSTGKPLIDSAVTHDPGHFKGVDKDLKSLTESMICVPLTCAGQRLGVMQVINKVGGNYTKRDLLLLQHFGDQAAVAIRNAQLFRSLIAHMGLFASPALGVDLPTMVTELERPARLEKLSLLFADMRSFTQLCQIMHDPTDLHVLLNEFLSMIAAEVIRHKGIVNKFIGDGLFAFFRGDGHAERAVRSALAMTTRFDALKQQWRKGTNLQLNFIDIGIGIVTDKAILGTTGVEGGVRDFTAVGTSVNLANFFETQARDGRRILVDSTTYRAVEDWVEANGPSDLVLMKPGQTVGHKFEHYHLLDFKAAACTQPTRSPAPEPKTVPMLTPEVFISYSHRDAKWLRRLQRHLEPLKPRLAVWDDTMLETGTKWREAIEQALVSARVAVLLVTPDFLASEFIRKHELQPLIARAQSGGVKVFWIAVSASAYEETEIRHYQAANVPTEPLDTLTPAKRNQALVDICKRIKHAAAAT